MRDLTGQVFGKVTVLGFSHKKGKMRYWLCRCECGTERPFPERGLLWGNTKSCGCIRKELPLMKASKHGGTGSLLYNVWHALKDVCLNENSGAYYRYGARGITICDEWRNDFAVFRDWAYEHGYSVYPPVVLRRLDTSGDFEPDNCMWLRVKKSKKIAYRGVEHTVAEWARIFGVDKGTLRHRLRNCDHDLAAACKDPIGRDKKQIDLDALIPAPKDVGKMPRKRWGDLTGQVFGRFTVLGFSHKKGTVKYWRCRCECGNERTVAAQSLLSGASKSCGCLRALRRKDLTGQVFGKLTVLGYAGSNGFVSLWRCRCECGNETVVPRGSLTTGSTKSCGCLGRGGKKTDKLDIIGKRFGRLTVIALDEGHGGRPSYLCRCDCGNEKVVSRNNLITGNTKSCGCIRHERFNDLTGQVFGRLTALEISHKKENMYYWRCRCSCGNEKIVSRNALMSGGVKSCGCLRHDRFDDLTGRIFGRLTVLGISHKKGKIYYWRCRCSCGNEKTIARNALVSGRARSCGCEKHTRIQDLRGRVFGRLLVIGHAGSHSQGSLWRCRCECGNEIVVKRNSLVQGFTKSCGCLRKDLGGLFQFKHGGSRTRLYSTWIRAKHNANGNICDEWRDFSAFRDWALVNGYDEGKKLYLYRKNVADGYSPENCEWILRKGNSIRSLRAGLEYGGLSMSIAAWAKLLEVNFYTLYVRLSKCDKDLAKACEKPFKGKQVDLDTIVGSEKKRLADNV